jgi:DNA-binding NarL/FixJ family response regulator
MPRSDAPRVLIVDDSPDALQMLSDALTMEGMHVVAASSGRQAVTMANMECPDLVLLDAMMPGMDGFEACKIMKSIAGFEDVPVIFMTGFNENEHVVQALSSGGVDFITKPIVLDQLFARMRVHLSNARRSRSARRALDSTGRRIVACDRNGRISWSTPQASGLLAPLGVRSEPDSYLPWEVVDWLSRPGVNTFHYSNAAGELEFKILSDYEDREILLRLIDRARGTDEEQLAKAFGLTLREAEVLLWIAHGKSNKEIAEILTMSPRTVNKHLEQIFNKLAVEKRTSAATLAVRVLWRDG